MREIINPWTTQNVSNYNCFGCNPNNPLGLHMHFYWDGAKVISFWNPNENFVSWPGTLHGGIQATLLDEICGWVIFYQQQTSGVTAKMELRYRKPVLTSNKYLELHAFLKETKHNILVVIGQIYNDSGELCAECECTYFTFPEQKAIEMGYLSATLSEVDMTREEVLQHLEHHQI